MARVVRFTSAKFDVSAERPNPINPRRLLEEEPGFKGVSVDDER
jgi:hypothetical protein